MAEADRALPSVPVLPSKNWRRLARTSAREVAEQLGHPATGLRRQPAGSSSVVLDDIRGRRVYIVLPPTTDTELVRQKIELLRQIAGRVPFTTPLPGAELPVRASSGLSVSVYDRLEVRAGRPDWQQVGATLRRLHDTPLEMVSGLAPDLPAAGALDDVPRQVSMLLATGRLQPPEASALTEGCDRLRQETAGIRADPPVLVHGDLHPANVLTVAGRVVLCDIDELSIGSAAWDLGFLADPGRRDAHFDTAAQQAFSVGYGARVPPRALARSVSRVAHLRQLVRELSAPHRSWRHVYRNRLRVACWERMAGDWSLDLVPVVALTRPQQVTLLSRRLLGRTDEAAPHP